MRIVHTIASLRSEHGGPSRTATALCSALAAQGADVRLVTTRIRQEGSPVLPHVDVTLSVVTRPSALQLYGTGHNRWTREVETSLDRGSALIHDHGIWLPTNYAVARLARRKRIRRVVSVRGMLSRQARSQHAIRKEAAWRMYQRRDLASADVVHVTSEGEYEDIRSHGISAPIALIPNGVELPGDIPRHAGGHPRMLFLGRIHPMKGLVPLVQAWARVRPAGWILQIAGPDEAGYEATVRAEIDRLDLNGEVEFLGQVDDARKWEVLGNADAFILPSLSENFGLVVAEAMAAGLPVVTTTATPWDELESHGCGWQVAPGVDPLVEALRELTSFDESSRRKMGRRGLELVRARYAWDGIAKEMSAVYSWMLAEGPRPTCIRD